MHALLLLLLLGIAFAVNTIRKRRFYFILTKQFGAGLIVFNKLSVARVYIYIYICKVAWY